MSSSTAMLCIMSLHFLENETVFETHKSGKTKRSQKAAAPLTPSPAASCSWDQSIGLARTVCC